MILVWLVEGSLGIIHVRNKVKASTSDQICYKNWVSHMCNRQQETELNNSCNTKSTPFCAYSSIYLQRPKSDSNPIWMEKALFSVFLLCLFMANQLVWASALLISYEVFHHADFWRDVPQNLWKALHFKKIINLRNLLTALGKSLRRTASVQTSHLGCIANFRSELWLHFQPMSDNCWLLKKKKRMLRD